MYLCWEVVKACKFEISPRVYFIRYARFCSSIYIHLDSWWSHGSVGRLYGAILSSDRTRVLLRVRDNDNTRRLLLIARSLFTWNACLPILLRLLAWATSLIDNEFLKTLCKHHFDSSCKADGWLRIQLLRVIAFIGQPSTIKNANVRHMIFHSNGQAGCIVETSPQWY